MVKRISHFGHLVANLAETLEMYQNNFGLKPVSVTSIGNETKNAMIPLGDLYIELIQPIDPNGLAAKALAARGEGLYHICFLVDNLEAEAEAFKAKGARVMPGLGDPPTVFIHPKSTKGVLMELWTEESRRKFLNRKS
ncbi:MAG: VOC family protein [Dehalococcoidia bacterium]|nr:VOC family protein [Dehalococcoidia bacterium]